MIYGLYLKVGNTYICEGYYDSYEEAQAVGRLRYADMQRKVVARE